MKGIWMVFSQTIGDEKRYIVGRKIDDSKPLHCGNVEYCGEYTSDRDACVKTVDYLNEKELQRGG